MKRKTKTKKQRGGNCNKPVGDCMNNPIPQLGSIPTNPSASEIAFDSRQCCGIGKAGSQNGGGYYFKTNSCPIGGQAEVVKYDNNCPPIFVGELLMRGGKSKKKNRKRIKRKYNSKKQKGGKMHNINPVFDLEQLNTSVCSDFSPNMNTRQFNCKQPNWDSKCI